MTAVASQQSLPDGMLAVPGLACPRRRLGPRRRRELSRRLPPPAPRRPGPPAGRLRLRPLDRRPRRRVARRPPGRVDWLEGELDGALAGRAAHPIVAAAAATVVGLGISDRPSATSSRPIARTRWSRRTAPSRTWSTTAGSSANPVGRLVLAVFGASTPEHERWSDAICTGLQLVEHWQDVAEDAAAGRIYLPARGPATASASTRPSCSAARQPRRLRALMAFEVARARRCSTAGHAARRRPAGPAPPGRGRLRRRRPGRPRRHRRGRLRRARQRPAGPHRSPSAGGWLQPAPARPGREARVDAETAYRRCEEITGARGPELLLRDPAAAGRRSAGPCRPSTPWPGGSTTSATATAPADERLAALGRRSARTWPALADPGARRATTRCWSPWPTRAGAIPIPVGRLRRADRRLRDGRARAPATTPSTTSSATAGGWPAPSAGSRSASSGRADPASGRAAGRRPRRGPAADQHPARHRRGPRSDGPGVPARGGLERFGCRADLSGPEDAVIGAAPLRGGPGPGAGTTRAWPLLPMLDRRSRACTAAMAGIYRRLLDRIQRDPAAVLRGRISLPPWEKAWVAGTQPCRERAMSRPGRVVVVGGGLAGITAALSCADSGARVTLLERRPHLGGLTWSFRHGDWVRQRPARLPALLHRLPRLPRAHRRLRRRRRCQDRLDLPVLAPGRPATGWIRRAGPAAGPAPPGRVPRRATAHLPVADRLARAGGPRRCARLDLADPALDDETFGAWLAGHGQTPAAIAAPLGPDHRPDRQPPGGRGVAWRWRPRSSRPGCSPTADRGRHRLGRVPLGRLHGERAGAPCARAGVEVLHRRAGRRRSTRAPASRVAAPSTAGASTPTPSSSPVPHDAVGRILPAGALVPTGRPARASAPPPSSTCTSSTTAGSPTLAIAAGVGSPVQFVFDRTGSAGVGTDGQYLAVSLSAADELLGTPARRADRRDAPPPWPPCSRRPSRPGRRRPRHPGARGHLPGRARHRGRCGPGRDRPARAVPRRSVDRHRVAGDDGRRGAQRPAGGPCRA